MGFIAGWALRRVGTSQPRERRERGQVRSPSIEHCLPDISGVARGPNVTIRFVMVGGFLGAGKTTMLARLARMYAAKGLRVGVVTNDQAHDLVDTNTFRRQGLAVEEVPGACFCCRFDEL